MASSFLGFILELAWIRKFSLVFGNLYISTSTVFAALFLGFAAGSYYSLKNIKTVETAYKKFGYFNIIAFSTSIAGYLLFSNHQIVSFFYNLFIIKSPLLLRFLQFIVISIILFPWAFCYGSALPLLSAITSSKRKNNVTTYCIFSVSGLAGLVFGAFFLLPSFGLLKTFSFSIAGYLLLGMITLYFSKVYTGRLGIISNPNIGNYNKKDQILFPAVSFFLGFCSIGYELLLLKSFSLIDNNSFYSFNIVLVFVLISSIIGSMIILLLSKSKFINNTTTFPILLVVSAVIVSTMPFVFLNVTEGMLPLPYSNSWYKYLSNIIKVSLWTIILPCILTGSLFPLLIKRVEDTGFSIGKVLFFNTSGIIISILSIGLINFYLWKWVLLLGFLYSISSLIYGLLFFSKKINAFLASLVIITLIMVIKIDLPVVWKNASLRGMDVIEKVENGGDIATLVANGNAAHILVNNQYSVGSNRNIQEKSIQSLLPITIHGNSKNLFFVGMGTGVTAGAALLSDLESVTVCEISSGVEKLARKYFQNYVQGLFNDKRVKIINEDGRIFLSYSKSKYDLIISDMFIPWQSGTAPLYTKDFYISVREHLNTNGLFTQWLPLYQLTMNDFGIIVNTLSEVFGQVTMWRAGFDLNEPAVALVCSIEKNKFVPDRLINNSAKEMFKVPYSSGFDYEKVVSGNLLQFYCGNITENKRLFENYKINTYDKLPIEYITPKSFIIYDGYKNILNNSNYLDLCGLLLKNIVPEEDPFLKNVSENDKQMVHYGMTRFE